MSRINDISDNGAVTGMIMLGAFSGLAFYILNQVLRYPGWDWPAFLGTIFWIILVFALALSQPLYFWGKEKVSDSPWVERLQIMGFLAIHYVSDILTLIMIRDFIGFPAWAGNYFGIWNWDGWNLYTSELSAVILFLPFLLLGAGYMVVHMGPYAKKIKLKDPRIPKSFDGFRFALMSDVHMGPMMRPHLVKNLMRKLKSLKFDAIVMTGDIVDCDPERYPDDVAALKSFEAPEGVYYCPGNHEYYWGLEKALRPIREAGVRVLMNEFSEIKRGDDKLRIWGAPDPISRYFPSVPGFDLSKLNLSNDGAFEILLLHQPQFADQAVEQGFHLQLSGHTHAGQFFPWNYLIVFFQKYSKGMYGLKSKNGSRMNLYVNQGTGFWGPPTRLGTYGEITLITLKSSSERL